LLTGTSTCHGCVIACGRKVTILDGPYARPEGKGPEYETMVGFGPNLLIDDLAAITHLGQLCDSYGLDTISTSNIVGLAYLLHAEGHLTEREAGTPLQWGDPGGAQALIGQIARREGLGAVAAGGARALARHFGVEEMAAQVNNLEVAYHDPRKATGMALVYATSPRGACHNQSDYFMVNLGQSLDDVGVPMTEWQGREGKALGVARHQNWRTVGNALVFCQFANTPPERLLQLVNAATGFDYTLDELALVGERAWNLKRAINHRLGLTRANDRLPKHLLQAYGDGAAGGEVPDLPALLGDYYKARGWDERTGRPTEATLERLGLHDAARDLWGGAG
jgi:aldehyde:ferredoxin oxidoreductase